MKVKIKMGNTLAASPSGILNPGKIELVDEKLAGQLVDGGYAEFVRTQKIETATVKPEEKAIKIEPEVKKKQIRKKRLSKKAVK